MSLGSPVQKAPVYLLSSVPFLLLSTVRRELLKHITGAVTAPVGCGPRGGVAGVKEPCGADHLWGFLPHSWVSAYPGPTALKTGLRAAKTKENLLPRECLLPSRRVSETRSSHRLSGKSPGGRATVYPKHWQQGQGQGQGGSLLTGSWRERPFRSGDHVLFFP